VRIRIPFRDPVVRIHCNELLETAGKGRDPNASDLYIARRL
jgi:hypothetical protein